MNKEKYISLE